METKLDTFRCYHFNNFYLTGVHAGIQAAHAQHELSLKYMESSVYFEKSKVDHHGTQENDYLEWLENHKTIILLNAGMAQDLEELVELFDTKDNPFPWAEWRESKEALNGCITSIAMVLPDRIYEWSRLVTKAWNRKPYQGNLYKTDNPNYLLLKEDDGSGKIIGPHSGHVFNEFTPFEIQLMAKMAGMKLMS